MINIFLLPTGKLKGVLLESGSPEVSYLVEEIFKYLVGYVWFPEGWRENMSEKVEEKKM